MKKGIIVITVLLMAATSWALGLKDDYHVVRRGETLSKIAAKHRISQSVLMRYNNLIDADRIYIGQIIWLRERVPEGPFRKPSTAARLWDSEPGGPFRKPSTEAPLKEEDLSTVFTERWPPSWWNYQQEMMESRDNMGFNQRRYPHRPQTNSRIMINGQPGRIIYQDSNKTVYGGPGIGTVIIQR